MGYDFYPFFNSAHCVFSIPLQRLRDKKTHNLDKNYIPLQIMKDPYNHICVFVLVILCGKLSVIYPWQS